MIEVAIITPLLVAWGVLIVLLCRRDKSIVIDPPLEPAELRRRLVIRITADTSGLVYAMNRMTVTMRQLAVSMAALNRAYNERKEAER